MMKYDEIRKISTRKGDDYTQECLLDCQYFKDYQLISVDLSKQKELEFYGKVKTNSEVCAIKKKNKRNSLVRIQ